MPVEALTEIGYRVAPMLNDVAREYAFRTPAGYPIVAIDAERGAVGIQLDPSFSLYFVSDGTRLYSEFSYRSARNDARSSAGREKFSGSPIFDRRPISADIGELELRNLIAELLSRYNTQPALIHITDT